jgi:DNA polymerase (family X)
MSRASARYASRANYSPSRGFLADELLDLWLADGTLRKRPNINGSVTWGEYNKLAVHRSGIPVDLFATTADRWFVTLVMRTGPSESNVALAAAAKRRGMQFHAYGMLEGRDGQSIITQSEQEVFERCGMPYREPEQR